MKYSLDSTKWPETFRIVDETGKMLSQGDYLYCVDALARYQYCDGKPPCPTCGHDLMQHLSYGTTHAVGYSYGDGKRYSSACRWSSGWSGSDWCDCAGYPDERNHIVGQIVNLPVRVARVERWWCRIKRILSGGY